MAELIEMPKLSDTMTTGTLVKWLKKEGDAVSSGEMIAEVETDKATMEVECFEDGVLLKQYVKEGDVAAIGAAICAIGEKGEEAPEVEASVPADTDEDEEKTEDSTEKEAPEEESKEDSAQEEKGAGATEKPARTSAPVQTEDSGDRVKASPLARRMAEEKGLDLSLIQGSGPNGRVIKEDVLKAEKNPPAAATSASTGSASSEKPVALMEDSTIKVTNMRTAIAKALVKSKTEAPHFYLQTEIDAAPLLALRKQINESLSELAPGQGGAKFSVNDFILKASAEAVRRVPAINRSWQGDTIKQYGSVHLAFGVAIDDGLVTPVIRDAHGKSLRTVSAEAKDLIGKARDRKLKPDEMSGSTLTVTNLGMYGITDFYGIINPNNAAILSVGATEKKAVVGKDDAIVVGYRMKIGLSGDHRVIDGAVGAQYLAALKAILEAPGCMLV